MNYRKFRADNDLPTGDMIAFIKERHPKYSKATQSMVDNPADYGVCLLPKLQKELNTAFGKPRAPRKAKAKNVVKLELSDDLMKLYQAGAATCGCTVEEFLIDRLTAKYPTA